MPTTARRTYTTRATTTTAFQFSIGDALLVAVDDEDVTRAGFNSLLEMPEPAPACAPKAAPASGFNSLLEMQDLASKGLPRAY